jgi:hypothetical protein
MSNESNSLAIFSRAAVMLAEADTIQKAHELKNLALTAADFAKRKNMGEEAIKYCRSYALEAERKMGEMLRQTERAKGGRPTEKTCTTGVRVSTSLNELGLTRKESSKAQFIAKLPEETFEQIKSGEKTIKQIKPR